MSAGGDILERLFTAGRTGLKRSELYYEFHLYQRPELRQVFEDLIAAGSVVVESRKPAEHKRGRTAAFYVHRAHLAINDAPPSAPIQQAYIFAGGFRDEIAPPAIYVSWGYDPRGVLRRLNRELPFQLGLLGSFVATKAEYRDLRSRLRSLTWRNREKWFHANDHTWDAIERFQGELAASHQVQV